MVASRWCDKYEVAYFTFLGERYLWWDADSLIPIEHAVVLGFRLEDLVGVEWILFSPELVPSNIQAAMARFMGQARCCVQRNDSNFVSLDAKQIESQKLSLMRGGSYVER